MNEAFLKLIQRYFKVCKKSGKIIGLKLSGIKNMLIFPVVGILVAGPILIDFMLHRITRIVKNLVVYPENMTRNLNMLKGLIFSQQVLLTLAAKGLERQEAYVMVQRNAMKVWETGKEFKQLLMEDAEITRHLGKEEIEELFSLDYHLKYVDEIFGRVFGA